MAARFITFEGLDGSGKSTHLRQAAQWLQECGIAVHPTREPGGTPAGDAIRQIFLDQHFHHLDARVEALLVFASRRQHLIEVIEPALAQGVTVLCDRFTDSTYAYQGGGRALDWTWIQALDQLATDSRKPDFTLLFDLPPHTSVDRRQSPKRQQRPDGVNRLDSESGGFYEKARAVYFALVEREPERFRVIDSSGSRAATWAQVERVLAEILELPV